MAGGGGRLLWAFVAWCAGCRLWVVIDQGHRALTVVPDLRDAACIACGVALLAGRRGVVPRAGGWLLLAAAATTCYFAAGFWRRTGAALDFDLAWHGLRNMGDLDRVVSSEIRWLDWGSMALPFVAVLGARPWRVTPGRAWRAFALIAVVTTAASLLAGGRSLFARLAPWNRVAPDTVAADWRAWLPPPDRLRAAWQRRPRDAPTPNIVWIVLEGVRADATSVYAPDRRTTPFLARLAARSVVFDEVRSLVPHTTKSLLAMHCGYPPELHKQISEPGRLPAKALPALLRDLGYRTAFFQTATEFFEKRRRLVDALGYEEFYAAQSLARPEFERVNYLGIEDKALVAPVLRWIGASRGRPFFAGLLNVTTHHDYRVPQSFEKRALGPGVKRGTPFHDYLQTVAYVDGVIEQLIEGLERGGHARDTVVFVTSDHGEAFGEHGLRSHDLVLYEEGVHVPLLLFGPQRLIGPPRHDRSLRQVTDLFATVADLVGVPGQQSYAGPALGLSLLAPAPADRRIFLSSHYENRMLATLQGHTKQLFDFLTGELATFDLTADPGEQRPRLEPDALGHDVVLEMRRFRAATLAWWQAANTRAGRRARRLPRPSRAVDLDLGNDLRATAVDFAPAIRLGHVLDVHLALRADSGAERRTLVCAIEQYGRRRSLPIFEGATVRDISDEGVVRFRCSVDPERVLLGRATLLVGTAGGTLVPAGTIEILPVAR